jgi:hypothetical protein
MTRPGWYPWTLDQAIKVTHLEWPPCVCRGPDTAGCCALIAGRAETLQRAAHVVARQLSDLLAARARAEGKVITDFTAVTVMIPEYRAANGDETIEAGAADDARALAERHGCVVLPGKPRFLWQPMIRMGWGLHVDEDAGPGRRIDGWWLGTILDVAAPMDML